MIELGVDNQDRQFVCGINGSGKRHDSGLQVAILQFYTVCALRREPAPGETLGRDPDLAAFLRRPVEVLIH